MTTPAANPQKRSRALDHVLGLGSEPTRKAPRRKSEDLSPTDAIIKDLHAAVSALKAVDPQSITEEQCESINKATYELLHVESRIDDHFVAASNPPLDETPIPFDQLVHALAFLPATDLAVAASVSRYFARATPEAVKVRLNRLALMHSGTASSGTTSFQLKSFERPSTELLQRIEEEAQLLPIVIASIDPSSLIAADYDTRLSAIRQLMMMHEGVVHLHRDELVGKLKEVLDLESALEAGTPGEESLERMKTADLRNNLMMLLEDSARLNDDHSSFFGLVLRDLQTSIPSLAAWMMLRKMPKALIEEHVHLIVDYLAAKGLVDTVHEDINAEATYILESLVVVSVEKRRHLNGLRSSLEQVLALRFTLDQSTRELARKLLREL